MVDQWFYGREENKLGPFSSRELRDLATAGTIRPTDTVWKAGIEKGVAADRVKNLFAPTPADAVPPAVEPPSEPSAAPPPSAAAPSPPIEAYENAASEPPPPHVGKIPMPPGRLLEPARKARATAGRGAVIVSQDGHAVQFRKKCIGCGHVDASKNRMIIRNGTTRFSYYCPKCRKLQPVEIGGHL